MRLYRKRLHKRNDVSHNYNSCKSEAAGCREADPPLDVQRNIAVIPPDRVKPFLQNPGGHKFHDGAARCTEQENLPDGIKHLPRHRREQAEQDHGSHNSAPVNRTDRPEQKAPVLPVLLLCGAVGALIQPSHKAENDKVIKILRNNHFRSLLSGFSLLWAFLPVLSAVNKISCRRKGSNDHQHQNEDSVILISKRGSAERRQINGRKTSHCRNQNPLLQR